MAIKPVLKMGDPVLFRVADPVSEFDTLQLHQLIADMRDTMGSLNGAGIAAPQIGVSQRVVIFGVQTDPENSKAEGSYLQQAEGSYSQQAEGSYSQQADGSRYPDADKVPETVLINPKIEVLSTHRAGMWEG